MSQLDDFLLVKDDSMAALLVGGDLLVNIHSKESPSANAWAQLLQFYSANRERIPKFRVLAITDGGGPTPEMRKTLQREFGKEVKGSRMAILSDATLVRFTVSAISLFVPHIRTFESRTFPEALSFLELSTEQRRAMAKTLAALKSTTSDKFKTFHSIDTSQVF